MRYLLMAVCLLAFTRNDVARAQADSATIAMNTFMAKDPGGNASLANISMWPNPATGSVNVYMNSIRPGDRGQAVLFTTGGTPRIITNLQNGNNKIYFGSLPPGIYFLNVRLHNSIIFSKKLIVIR